MPARKPLSLITRHETAAETHARSERESVVKPGRKLPMEAPARLSGLDVAQVAWRNLMREFAGIDGEIVTRLDMDLMVDYCVVMQQISEMDAMRKTGLDVYLALEAQRIKLIEDKKLEDALLIGTKAINVYDAIVKIDARVDRKRALAFQFRQSMYLTPRARAGAAPDKKEKEPPIDDMENLLNDVTDFVNGDEKKLRKKSRK